jgi:hypothetical protein
MLDRASAAIRKFALMFTACVVANFRLKSCTRIINLLVHLILGPSSCSCPAEILKTLAATWVRISAGVH